jgi:hypothetical protein
VSGSGSEPTLESESELAQTLLVNQNYRRSPPMVIIMAKIAKLANVFRIQPPTAKDRSTCENLDCASPSAKDGVPLR